MNGDRECAIGWNPSIAKPAATPTIACSMIPMFTTRVGCRGIASAK